MNGATGTGTIRLANAPVSYGVFGELTVDAATTPADLLITMGAGDVTGLGQELVRRLGRPTGDAGPGTEPSPT